MAEPTAHEAGDTDTSGRQAESDDRAAARRDQRAVEENAAARDRAADSDRPPDTHAEDIRLIGRAQDMVMRARDLSAAEALLALYQRANTDGTDLRTTARRIIDGRAEP